MVDGHAFRPHGFVGVNVLDFGHLAHCHPELLHLVQVPLLRWLQLIDNAGYIRIPFLQIGNHVKLNPPFEDFLVCGQVLVPLRGDFDHRVQATDLAEVIHEAALLVDAFGQLLRSDVPRIKL